MRLTQVSSSIGFNLKKTKRGVCAECKVDLVFLMDGSWSIGKRRFKIQKDFLSEVAQSINLGVTGPMMGVVQYG